MIITAKNCWAGAQKLHTEYFDKTVVAEREKNKVRLTADIYDFLVSNHAQIRDGNESDFRKLQNDYNAIFALLVEADQKNVHLAICDIFDYSAFSKKCKVRWCAYKLCNTLDIATCPYCNLSIEVTIIKDRNGRVRPAIDHFFDKARYPLFAISLGNLIPSCHHCNSTFKGVTDFFKFPHLNPLYDAEKIQFSLDVDAIDARLDVRKIDKANMRIIYDRLATKEENSVSTFEILSQYQARITEIRDIVKNMVSYSTSGQYDPAQLDWVRRNVTTKNYRDRSFGKMVIDFSSEYI